MSARLLAEANARLPRMVSQLKSIVEAESPSEDLEATRRCAGVISGILKDETGVAPQTGEAGGRVHLLWRRGGPARVALLAHMDTVWPLGTIAERPFSLDDDVARGPGVFDMKAGIVQAIAALSMTNVPGVALLVTSDEETGSTTSRSMIEGLARETGTVLVLEPSEQGALKVARKGTSLYDLDIRGRAAHAGLAPDTGVNTTVESAFVVLTAMRMSDMDAGTTVTPTTLSSGHAGNVIPDAAHLHIDARAWSIAELERVDHAIRGLEPTLAGATIEVSGGINRAPLERAASDALFDLARRCATGVGLHDLHGVGVGGGSDGNIAAAVGAATLDGLGAVGGGAHARTENVSLAGMCERAAVVAAILEKILGAASADAASLWVTSGRIR